MTTEIIRWIHIAGGVVIICASIASGLWLGVPIGVWILFLSWSAPEE